MVRLCIAGVSGRMGSAVAREAIARGWEITGAIAAQSDSAVGKTLAELGIAGIPLDVFPPGRVDEAAQKCDVYISFTSPEAEMVNLPVVSSLKKPIVMGTTGFTQDQLISLKTQIGSKVAAVFASNFSPGIDIMGRLAKVCAAFPPDYDWSIVETHHTGKKDSPSGTAKMLGDIAREARGYNKIVHGRQGNEPRVDGELEILSARAGGVPGIHELVIAGPFEMLRIEHTAFSRNVFAQGALYAAEWVSKQKKPGIYGMGDVIG